MRALAQALGIGLFDTYDSGDNVYLNNGQRSTFSDSSPTGSAPLDPVILPDLTTAVTQLDQMATEIPVDAPWTAAMQRVLQGALIKAGAVYDRPWWRDKGLNGSSVPTDGLVSATFDDSPEDASLGVLFGFIGGDKARQFNTMARNDRQSAVLSEFATLFGPEATGPQRYFETNWTEDPWSRGCPVALYGPGTLVAYGPALRAPVGNIHWAGTETSNYWNGYMDGAVRSGDRAAKEALS